MTAIPSQNNRRAGHGSRQWGVDSECLDTNLDQDWKDHLRRQLLARKTARGIRPMRQNRVSATKWKRYCNPSSACSARWVSCTDVRGASIRRSGFLFYSPSPGWSRHGPVSTELSRTYPRIRGRTRNRTCRPHNVALGFSVLAPTLSVT